MYPVVYDKLMTCNYVMFKNKAYGDGTKWFYSFITKIEYLSPNSSKIYIQTDVMQTWMFNYSVKASFVEREHVNDDTVGKHTIPEGLETGEYIVYEEEKSEDQDDTCFIVASTLKLSGLNGGNKCDGVEGALYNGIYSGVRYYYFANKLENELFGSEECLSGVYALNALLHALAEEGQSDGITAIFTAPSSCVVLDGPEKVDLGNGDLPFVMYPVKQNTGVFTRYWKLNDAPNYTEEISGIKNNKLLAYPYRYITLTNNNGGSAIYRYEMFQRDFIAFDILTAITPGCSIRAIPYNYKTIGKNYNEGLTGAKYPICNWNTDIYTNWLKQNGANMAISVGTSVLSAGLAVAGALAAPATGGMSLVAGLAAAGSVAGGVSTVASAVGEINRHSMQPPQAEGNLNSGDVCFSAKEMAFKAQHTGITAEYAKVIDGYFTMYGYKVNTVHVPLAKHRENFWYTKTIDVNLDGAIPAEDMQMLKNCYNNGITFWRNPSKIGDYSVSNKIV